MRVFWVVLLALVLSACSTTSPRAHGKAAGHGHGGTASTSTTAAGNAGKGTPITAPISTGTPKTTGGSKSSSGTPSPTLPSPTTTTTMTPIGPGPVTAIGQGGGLSIEITAAPAHGSARTPVTFTIKAVESAAPGALHYLISYGDGTNDSNITPQVCTAGPGQPDTETWTLSHHYAAPGSYSVSVTVGVNCSPDKATAALTVNPAAS